MLFSQLKRGQKFKRKSCDTVYTHVAYTAYPFRDAPTAAVDGFIFDGESNCFGGLGEHEEVLTLQKVTKTEKKWVETKLRDTKRGQEFKFGPGSHEGVMIRLENHTEELKQHTFYVARDGSYLSTGIPWAPVWVEEETTIETEEWLP